MFVQYARSILFFFALLFVSSQVAAQKMYRSPDVDLSSDMPVIKIIGTIENKLACFVEEYDGYKILWYDSAMRKWGSSELDFLDRTTTDIRVLAGNKGVYVYHQKRNKKSRVLYVSEVLPIHKDTIKPMPIDSVGLVTVRDRSRIALFETNKENVMAYAISEYDITNRKFSYAVKTIQGDKGTAELLKGEFAAAIYNRIQKVHLTEANGAYVFFGAPANGPSTYQRIMVAHKPSAYEEVGYSELNLNENISNPIFKFDASTNQMRVGATLVSNRPNSNNSLWQGVYNLSSKQWADEVIAKNKVGDGRLNLFRTKLRNFIPKVDGGAIFFLEKSFEEIQTRSRSMAMMPSGMIFGGGSYNISVFHNDEVTAISTNNEGAIEWQKQVQKSQESSTFGELMHSYAILKYPIGNVLLYTNVSAGENKFITSYVSKDGDVQQRQFSSSVYERMEDDQILIQKAKQISVNEIVFPVLRRKTISFAKIQF